LCGLPEIDIEDWKRNTEYTGDYERKGSSHKVVKWFWEVPFIIAQEKRNKTKFILIYYYRSWSTILTRSIRPDFFSLLPVPQESNPVSETLCFGRRLGEHRCPHRASVRFKEMTIIYANLQSTLFQRQYRSSPRHILVSTASIYHCMIQRRS